MKELKEFREWFITPYKETLKGLTLEDLPVEQETPPATKIKYEDGKPVGTVFKKDHEPSEINYKKLFKSILFKLNASDRARDSDDPLYKTNKDNINSGHVTVATAQESFDWNNGEESLHTRTVRPSQLPEVEELQSELIGDFAISTINGNPQDTIEVIKNKRNDSDNNLLRSLYNVRLKFNFLTWIKDITTKTKAYIDSYALDGGIVTVDNVNPNQISIQDFAATNVASQRHEINLTLFLSDNEDLSGNRIDVPVSERAINQAITNALAASGFVDPAALAAILADYTTTADLNILLANQQAQITQLQNDLTALEARVTDLENTTYTQLQIDGFLAGKADIGHTHPTLYHPLVSGAITGDITLEGLSKASLDQGIVTNFNR